MKNLSLALNALLLVLVAILYFMYFSLKSHIAKEYGANPSPVVSAQGSARPVSIACINNDSISANYDLMRRLSADMQKRQQALQDEYETEGRKLQQEYAEYQQKAQSGNISQIDAQKAQKDMEQKKSQLDDLQRQQEELVKEAQDKNQELSEKVIDYVNKFNKSRNFDFVLTYSSTHGPLVVANPMYDITAEIVKGLNKENTDSLLNPAAKR